MILMYSILGFFIGVICFALYKWRAAVNRENATKIKKAIDDRHTLMMLRSKSNIAAIESRITKDRLDVLEKEIKEMKEKPHKSAPRENHMSVINGKYMNYSCWLNDDMPKCDDNMVRRLRKEYRKWKIQRLVGI